MTMRAETQYFKHPDYYVLQSSPRLSFSEDRETEVLLVTTAAGNTGPLFQLHELNIQEACRAAALGEWLSINSRGQSTFCHPDFSTLCFSLQVLLVCSRVSSPSRCLRLCHRQGAITIKSHVEPNLEFLHFLLSLRFRLTFAFLCPKCQDGPFVLKADGS